MSYFVYPLICCWTCWLFPPLPIVNNAAMNMGVQLSVWVSASNSLGRTGCPHSGKCHPSERYFYNCEIWQKPCYQSDQNLASTIVGQSGINFPLKCPMGRTHHHIVLFSTEFYWDIIRIPYNTVYNLKYTIQWFFKNCATITTIIFGIFSPPPKETMYPLAVTPYFSQFL